MLAAASDHTRAAAERLQPLPPPTPLLQQHQQQHQRQL
eukprot:COSAG01_NODE_24823_length_765_cov_0.849850_1_plen_37_part_10